MILAFMVGVLTWNWFVGGIIENYQKLIDELLHLCKRMLNSLNKEVMDHEKKIKNLTK
jgi:hypothetical protein